MFTKLNFTWNIIPRELFSDLTLCSISASMQNPNIGWNLDVHPMSLCSSIASVSNKSGRRNSGSGSPLVDLIKER
jgi:hypothetical protein